MIQITVYQTDDGARFDTRLDALIREALLAEIAIAARSLGPVPKAVEDGNGWVHHSLQNVRAFKHALLRLARPHLERYEWYHEERFDEIHPRGVVGRILDDCGGPLSLAWWRLMCIDEQGREHQQPYLAIKGPRLADVCIEDRR